MGLSILMAKVTMETNLLACLWEPSLCVGGTLLHGLASQTERKQSTSSHCSLLLDCGWDVITRLTLAPQWLLHHTGLWVVKQGAGINFSFITLSGLWSQQQEKQVTQKTDPEKWGCCCKKTLTPLKSACGRSRGVGSHGQESPSASWSTLDGVGMIRIGSKMQTIEAQSRRGTRFA